MNDGNALTPSNGGRAVASRETAPVVFTPRVDVLETDDALLLYADVPGVTPDRVDVKFENGELTLHCRCSPPKLDATTVWTEYGIGDYHRAFTINEQVDAANISAELKHGVLTVRLPRAESVRPRKIPVTGG